MKPSAPSIVLLSGGLDSALAFLMAKKNGSVKFALTFDYNQKTAEKEISSAKKICQHYQIEHKIISLPFFSKPKDHPFFNESLNCPQLATDQLDDENITKKSAAQVWVPNRNGIFLNIAAGIAETLKISSLYVGFNAEEAITFPDNSKDYLESTNQCFSYSTLTQIKVVSPTIDLIKSEIFKKLIEADFPLSLLWSCYHNHEKMCGHCESCQRLRRAAIQNNWSEKVEALFES